MVTAVHNVYDLAERLLRDAFPGMRFDARGERPQYANTNTCRSLVITYNVDLAAERGINQRHMREALKPIVEHSSVQYGTKTISTLYISRISFEKKHISQTVVNPARVQEILRKLTSVENDSDSNRESIQRTVNVLKEFVPRAQQPLFESVAEALQPQK